MLHTKIIPVAKLKTFSVPSKMPTVDLEFWNLDDLFTLSLNLLDLFVSGFSGDSHEDKDDFFLYLFMIYSKICVYIYIILVYIYI